MLKEKYTGKLLVEGKDDQHVFFAVCDQHGIAESFDIIDCESINNIIKLIPLRLKQDVVTSLGIVVDADQDLLTIWKSISNILQSFGYILPTDPPLGGYIHSAQGIFPKVGVWVMPDNTSTGMIEDFISSLIPDKDPLKRYVDEVLQQLEQLNYNRYDALLHHSKAYIRTYLAWQKDPGAPLGLSITKHYLDHNAIACLNLVQWLNDLFNN